MKQHDLPLRAAPVFKQLVHQARLGPQLWANDVTHCSVHPVAVENRRFGVDKQLVVGGEVHRAWHSFGFVQAQVQTEEVAESYFKIILYETFLQPVAVHHVEPAEALVGDELLINAVFVEMTLLVRVADVVFRAKKTVAERCLCARSHEIVGDGRAHKKLLQVAGEALARELGQGRA